MIESKSMEPSKLSNPFISKMLREIAKMTEVEVYSYHPYRCLDFLV